MRLNPLRRHLAAALLLPIAVAAPFAARAGESGAPSVPAAAAEATGASVACRAPLSGVSARRLARLQAYYSGKRVLITGASSGIGLETARIVHALGADVVMVARDPGKLARAADEVRAAGAGRVDVIPRADLRDPAVPEQVAASALAGGPVDILVNNAGVTYTDYLDRQTPDEIVSTVSTNLTAAMLLARALVPSMKERGTGQIVQVASLAGIVTFTGYPVYGATKAGLIQFSEGLRHELKPHGIGVSVFLPPDTETPMLERERDRMPPETRRINGAVKAKPADEVAWSLVEGMAARRFSIVPGFDSRLVAALVRLLPEGWRHAALDRMGKP